MRLFFGFGFGFARRVCVAIYQGSYLKDVRPRLISMRCVRRRSDASMRAAVSRTWVVQVRVRDTDLRYSQVVHQVIRNRDGIRKSAE
ncbi:hypothetical protein BJ138DRAFT_1156471 [Hygrophoropsis aurantiaca]|uniref:Uncharacterized protein n=1 Tax=Hygrophoropsis aurantiaca TaxID=72124 RepID=A0ACB8A8E0_9AGAM|nr:hypothetical protein BJ138DRAFT_1156471 [Hygrophoropsis aurantiaca]